MERLRKTLEAINRRYGAVGGVVSVAFWLAVLAYAVAHILGDFW